MHGRGPCPAPCEAMRACACVPHGVHAFSAAKLRKPFSVTPTLNISSSPSPPPPKPLPATPPSPAPQTPPTLAVPWNQGGGDPLTGLEGQTGHTWPVFPRSVPLNLFSINKTYRLQPDTFVRFEAMEFL